MLKKYNRGSFLYADKILKSKLAITLIVFLATLVVMTIYEVTKQFVFGHSLTLWQSHLITVLFTSIIAALLTSIVFGRLKALEVHSKEVALREERISIQQELLNALNVHASVSISDVTGRITYANQQFCEVSGYTENELIGQDHRILNSGHHDQEFFRKLWHTIANGQPWQGEVCNRNKQGLFYWVDSTIVPMLGLDGKPAQYISIRRNITKIKENETRLLSLKRALDASSEMIIVIDDHGAIQYVNPALCSFTDWQEDQLLGRPTAVIDSPNADPKTLSEMQSTLRQGDAWRGRILSRRKGASPISIAGQTTPPDTRDYWADVSIIREWPCPRVSCYTSPSLPD